MAKQTLHLAIDYSRPGTPNSIMKICIKNVITFTNHAKTILKQLGPQAINASKRKYKIDGSTFKTIQIVFTSFQIKDKLGKA